MEEDKIKNKNIQNPIQELDNLRKEEEKNKKKK